MHQWPQGETRQERMNTAAAAAEPIIGDGRVIPIRVTQNPWQDLHMGLRRP